MFDLLHMDLRRLVRDRALYIILAVFGVILLFVCVMMALTSNGCLLYTSPCTCSMAAQ